MTVSSLVYIKGNNEQYYLNLNTDSPGFESVYPFF